MKPVYVYCIATIEAGIKLDNILQKWLVRTIVAADALGFKLNLFTLISSQSVIAQWLKFPSLNRVSLNLW